MRQAEGITEWGRSKTSGIQRLRKAGISETDARLVTAADLISYAKDRRVVDGAVPATVLNDIVWLRQAFMSAVAHRGIREPLAADEEARLLEHFGARDRRARIPMLDIMQFALLTARRQEEICRIRWTDVDMEKGVGWVDDVKHPTRKKGKSMR